MYHTDAQTQRWVCFLEYQRGTALAAQRQWLESHKTEGAPIIPRCKAPVYRTPVGYHTEGMGMIRFTT